MTHAVPSLFPAKKFAGLPRTRFSRIRASLLLSAVRRSSVFEARSARQRSAARVMPTPSSPSSRDRETREAPDTALLTEPETYGSFAASLPGLTGADASLISPDSPTYGSSGLSASPFLNTPERAAYARGRSMAAAVAAEAGETHPDPRARVEAFAANLARVVRQPSDAMYAAAGREDPTAAMLREFKRALEAGDDDGATPGALLDDGLTGSRDATSPTSHSSDVANDAHSTVDRERVLDDARFSDAELEALTRPILGGSARAGREFGYGSTARERAAEADERETARESPSALGGDARSSERKAETMSTMSPLSADTAASPGRASARMRRRARSRTEPESTLNAHRIDPASGTPALSEKELFKIQCGQCSCMLKIPGSVSVFRCPRCAAKLRKPPGVFADSASSPKIKNRKDGKEEKRETTQKRSAFDEELASLRAAREALERHVAFSKSLEGVVGELAKRVPRVAA